MKKFYTFRAGQELPKWIFDFKCDDVGLHQNRHADYLFDKRCCCAWDGETHKQDHAKVNSQCDTLINMSNIDKYLEGLDG